MVRDYSELSLCQVKVYIFCSERRKGNETDSIPIQAVPRAANDMALRLFMHVTRDLNLFEFDKVSFGVVVLQGVITIGQLFAS